MRVVMSFLWSNPSFSGGVPRAVLDRSRFLARQGADVTIVTRGNREWHTPYEEEGVKIVPVFVRDLQFRRLGMHPPFLLSRLRDAICARGPFDVFDAHDGPLRRIAPAVRRSTGAVHIATLHNDPHRRVDTEPWLASKLYRAMEVDSRTHADGIVAVSQFLVDIDPILKRRQQVHVVHNSVPEDVLAFNRTAPPQDGPLRLIFAHRVVREKGSAELVEAFATARKEVDVRLTVMGSGRDEADMRQRAQSLGVAGDIDFHGQVSNRKDVLEALGSHHVYVMPTHFEAFSIGLLEAMGLGMCCLTSDHPSCLESIQDAGLTFPVGDANALAARIVELARDRARVEDFSGRAKARAELFRSERVTQKLVEAYEEVLRAARG